MKYCENPDNTETAGSDQGNDHGEEGVAHSSHASHHDIHEAAEEIRGADEMHSVEAVLDDLRVAFRNGVATGAGRQAAAREVAIAFGVAACSRTYRENFPGYTFPRCMSSQMAGDS